MDGGSGLDANVSGTDEVLSIGERRPDKSSGFRVFAPIEEPQFELSHSRFPHRSGLLLRTGLRTDVVRIPGHKRKQGETRGNTGVRECTPREN